MAQHCASNGSPGWAGLPAQQVLGRLPPAWQACCVLNRPGWLARPGGWVPRRAHPEVPDLGLPEAPAPPQGEVEADHAAKACRRASSERRLGVPGTSTPAQPAVPAGTEPLPRCLFTKDSPIAAASATPKKR